ncbi:hypothetical protein CEXT_291491 [Caerostris extrusa]|uniref:Uncharacterized protein n=1 Tax=Caerostris extrusa TaxID=172846 RepID=A0AAV4XZ56_CAEEX|nr:hypothetical protein CEXT_291491 [Caerostris extrusa]
MRLQRRKKMMKNLSNLYYSCLSFDVKLIVGDMNSKLDTEIKFKPFIGSFSLRDVSNDNGIRLVDFAAAHHIIVGSTCIQRKNIHVSLETTG